jgi:2-polyprenyl-6-methoxyphenol hydroxylase-like FAD-dependent oxidoreductase
MRVRCCIAGGGPAGMMLGFLLARAGIDVAVLEKHADFLRDFRGDTVHPSTLEIMHELGLLDEFLKRPHQELRQIGARIGTEDVIVSDLSHLPTRCRFVALMPQWDFLDFLAAHGRRYPTFQLRMKTEVTGLLEDSGRIVGVRAQTEEGPLEVRAELTVAADGRHSIVRERAGLDIEELGAPIDVLWMRLTRSPHDPGQTFGYLGGGQAFVMLDRGDYWQCGLVIGKGGFDRIRQQGIEAFRERIGAIVPFMRDRVGELKDWDDVRLLNVKIDRLRRWHRAGLLCIGDAAHAMSPVGGVGINLAIQDAVAAANRLAAPLRLGAPTTDDLEAVQRRRMFPTRATQRFQLLVQNRVLSGALAATTGSLPLVVRLFRRWPALRRIPARIIGIGFRPEHVKTADAFRAR